MEARTKSLVPTLTLNDKFRPIQTRKKSRKNSTGLQKSKAQTQSRACVVGVARGAICKPQCFDLLAARPSSLNDLMLLANPYLFTCELEFPKKEIQNKYVQM